METILNGLLLGLVTGVVAHELAHTIALLLFDQFDGVDIKRRGRSPVPSVVSNIREPEKLTPRQNVAVSLAPLAVCVPLVVLSPVVDYSTGPAAVSGLAAYSAQVIATIPSPSDWVAAHAAWRGGVDELRPG